MASPPEPGIRPIHDPVELQTPRLLLRPFRPDDLDRLADWQSRPEVARFLYWGPRSRPEAEAALELRLAGKRLERADDVVTLAVERREDGLLLGDVSIWIRSPENRQVEIGYVFHPDASGQGYATEAAGRLLDFAFDEIGAHRVFARTDPDNTASAAVLRRLGMREEAHLRESEIIKGEWADELTFALLADERPRP